MLAQPDVEESSRVFMGLGESKPIDDVIACCIDVVIHMNFIADIFPEGVVVGTAMG